MAGGSDDAEAEPLEVVVRVGEEGELVFAAVAGAGVDVADCEAAAAVWWWVRDGAAEVSEVAEEGQHQRSAQA